MIKKTKLIPIRLDYACLKCEKGKMQRVRKHHMLPDNAPYLHKCDKCDHQEELTESYPHIIYEEDEWTTTLLTDSLREIQSLNKIDIKRLKR